MMGDPVQSLSKTVHPEVAGPKLQQNPLSHPRVELAMGRVLAVYKNGPPDE